MEAPDVRVLRRAGIALLLSVALLFYVELFLYSRSRGDDLAVFTAAATALNHGQNPYDGPTLLAIQLDQGHRHGAEVERFFRLNPYLSPPLLAAALRLFGHGSTTAILWTTLQIAALVVGATLACTWADARRRLPLAVGLAASPACYLAVYYGQVSPFMLLATSAGLLYAQQRRCGLAAACMVIGMLKPQVMLGPLVIVGLQAWRYTRLRHFCVGLLLSAVGSAIVTVLITSDVVTRAWLSQMAHFSSSGIEQQVFDPGSVSFVSYALLPSSAAAALTLALIAAWLALSIRTMPQRATSTQGVRLWTATTLTGWLAVAPYVHPHDFAVLVPALCTMLRGRSGWRVSLALGCWVCIPLLWLLGVRIPVILGLGTLVPITILVALLWQSTARAESTAPALRMQNAPVGDKVGARAG